MSNNKPERSKVQDEPSRPQQVVKWAVCHPGVLLLSSLAVGTMLACRPNTDQRTSTDRRVETEADIIEGDVPLFAAHPDRMNLIEQLPVLCYVTVRASKRHTVLECIVPVLAPLDLSCRTRYLVTSEQLGEAS
jgi:hypothetical protein